MMPLLSYFMTFTLSMLVAVYMLVVLAGLLAAAASSREEDGPYLTVDEMESAQDKAPALEYAREPQQPPSPPVLKA